MQMTWKYVFLAVTGGALTGMVMGGLFGFVSGKLAPVFSNHAPKLLLLALQKITKGRKAQKQSKA